MHNEMEELERDVDNMFVYYRDGDNIYAYALVPKQEDDNDISDDESHEEIEAGELEVETDDDGNIWLNNIEVKTLYRRQGVAARMLQLAIDHLSLMCIPCVKVDEAYHVCLTLQGERFIAGCLDKNIITPDMCFFSSNHKNYSPFILEVPDENESSGNDDPRYDSDLVLNAIADYEIRNNTGKSYSKVFKNNNNHLDDSFDADDPDDFEFDEPNDFDEFNDPDDFEELNSPISDLKL